MLLLLLIPLLIRPVAMGSRTVNGNSEGWLSMHSVGGGGKGGLGEGGPGSGAFGLGGGLGGGPGGGLGSGGCGLGGLGGGCGLGGLGGGFGTSMSAKMQHLSMVLRTATLQP